MPRFTFAVIADSHFHPDGVPAQAAWKSDAAFNDRNRVVAALLARARPAFVVHLGDVPHPVPGLAAHREALAVARRTYDGLPLHVVPGNHDVGDKPHAWLPAPGVDEARHAVFREHWGAPWRSFDHDGCHFVLVDTPVLNSGLALEAEQWAWLEADLAAAAGRRTFVFLHYPLYLVAPDEPVHYDNLAEPARGRLLALCAGAEAIFAGHSHHFFWNRRGRTDLYVAPATSFVRPGFTELARVAPGDDEFGRNEAGRLGFFFVHVDDDGHRLEVVRTEGATRVREVVPALAPGRAPPPPCPLGVTLRHAWDAVLDIPCDNLDPFVRKRARNDLVIQATWDLGVTRLRLPVDDLRRPDTRERLAALHARGQRFVLFHAGPPDAATWALLRAHAGMIDALELILARTTLDAVTPPPGVPPIWLAPIGRRDPARDGVYFSHFPLPGFVPGDPELAALPGWVARPVYRVGGEVWEGVAGATGGVALVELPRGGESREATDDGAVAWRVAEAFAAARAFPDVPVLLDTFVDHDRGYFPRHGLLDRRSNPRAAFHVLRHLGRLVPPGAPVTRDGAGYRLGERRLGRDGDGVDLVTGASGAGPIVLG